MAQVSKPVFLNLGCGERKLTGYVNIDAYGTPDVLQDLNEGLPTFGDSSVDGIVAYHVFEHVADWWRLFTDCERVLKVGGTLDIHVPHASSDSALTYRDHLHVFARNSFDSCIDGPRHTTNAWFHNETRVKLRMVRYNEVPFKQFNWMVRWAPWLLAFASAHLRNFVWESQFHFVKVGKNG